MPQNAEALYLLLDYLPGGDLWVVLHETPATAWGGGGGLGGHMPDSAARFYTACFVDVLAFLHARGIVYRDVKPDNAVLDAGGYPVFVDFAFARNLPHVRDGRTITTASTQLGSAEYMAPEVHVRPQFMPHPGRDGGGLKEAEPAATLNQWRVDE